MGVFRVIAASVAVLFLADPGSAGPVANAPSVEVFAAPPLLDSPRLLPDGTKLAAKMLIRGEQTLVVYPLQGNAKPARVNLTGDSEPNWWRWVNDDWLIAGVGAQTSIYGTDVYITRLIGLKADMTKSVPIDWGNSGSSIPSGCVMSARPMAAMRLCGYAAMRLCGDARGAGRGAQRDGSRYRCAVSFAGISDLSAMMRYDRKFLSSEKSAKDYWKKQAPDFTAVSPRFHAADFAAPILLVHSNKDKRVPIAQSRWMAEESKKAGKPVDYIEQPLGDHHFSREADRFQFLKAMKSFLDRYNPA